MTTFQSVQWHGCITQGVTALRWSGNGQGGRVTFDIPAIEGAAFDELRALTERVLVITIMATDDMAGDDEPTYRDTVEGAVDGAVPFDEGNGEVTP